MYVIEIYAGWIEGARLMCHPDLLTWCLILWHVALVLIVFKLFSGSWGGFRRKKK
jgi:hypothetical protein